MSGTQVPQTWGRVGKAVAVGESMLVDDAALARTARTDAAAFDVLYRRHYDRVYRYVRTSLGHDEDAADVAQQVFVQAWRNVGRFEGRSSFATWLFRIAHNAVVDAQRGRRADSRRAVYMQPTRGQAPTPKKRVVGVARVCAGCAASVKERAISVRRVCYTCAIGEAR
jgi:DNA-directed RNA polymerase specialized sigma24 family protein